MGRNLSPLPAAGERTGGRHLGLGGRFLGRCRAGLAAAQAKKAVGGNGGWTAVEWIGQGRGRERIGRRLENTACPSTN